MINIFSTKKSDQLSVKLRKLDKVIENINQGVKKRAKLKNDLRKYTLEHDQLQAEIISLKKELKI